MSSLGVKLWEHNELFIQTWLSFYHMVDTELGIWELKMNRAPILRSFIIWWKSQVMVV